VRGLNMHGRSPAAAASAAPMRMAGRPPLTCLRRASLPAARPLARAARARGGRKSAAQGCKHYDASLMRLCSP